jgi:hypothetical protein
MEQPSTFKFTIRQSVHGASTDSIHSMVVQGVSLPGRCFWLSEASLVFSGQWATYHEFPQVGRETCIIVKNKSYTLRRVLVQVPNFPSQTGECSRGKVLRTAQVRRAAVLSIHGTGGAHFPRQEGNHVVDSQG